MNELANAEIYWILLSQQDHFLTEVNSLKAGHPIPRDSCLLPFRPFVDQAGVLCVGGRESATKHSSWQTSHHKTSFTLSICDFYMLDLLY